MHKRNKFIRVITAATIVVFVNFMFVNTIFMHTHKLADGSEVCHSHPFQHTPHSHTGYSLSIISVFNSAATSFQGTAMLVLAVLATVRAYLYDSTSLKWSNFVVSLSNLRAPPVLNIFSPHQ